MTQEEVFIDAIRATAWSSPRSDNTALLIYADWLEDNGDPRGEYLHLRETLARLSSQAPEYAEMEARKQRLRAEIESMSITFWGRTVAGKFWLGLLGEPVTGVVRRIENYGFFVDLGGIEGLVHITDMPW
jgi:uncharacterized protein (TIGR02996 family)